MDSLKNYEVDFVKLKLGQHDISFKIDDSFFTLKEHSLIEKGNVDVHLHIDKKERLMNFTFSIEGTVQVECDTCLDPFDLPVKQTESIVLKISEDGGDSDGEIIYLKPHEISFNVYDHIYELIVISMPLSKTCADSADGNKQCNQQMLAYLSGSTEEVDENDEEKPTDPRWDKLKNIK